MPINISRIDLICYDFDGVMTDNRALVLEDGTEAVFINRGDGLAVAALKEAGVPQIILSAEKNTVVATRGHKLQIPVLHGVGNKKTTLANYAESNGYALSNTIYVGNDINDLDVMMSVGCPVSPIDAHHFIRDIAVHITDTRGGFGVIRELYDILNDGGLL